MIRVVYIIAGCSGFGGKCVARNFSFLFQSGFGTMGFLFFSHAVSLWFMVFSKLRWLV